MSPVTKSALRWSLTALAAIALLTVVTAGWSRLWSWLPWSAESRADLAEARASGAEDNALARAAESRGNAELVVRVEAAGVIRQRAEAATASAVTQALGATDATEPLDADRADRLRGHDRQLCDISPAVCTPAAAGNAVGGGDALPTSHLAAHADPG